MGDGDRQSLEKLLPLLFTNREFLDELLNSLETQVSQPKIKIVRPTLQIIVKCMAESLASIRH